MRIDGRAGRRDGPCAGRGRSVAHDVPGELPRFAVELAELQLSDRPEIVRRGADVDACRKHGRVEVLNVGRLSMLGSPVLAATSGFLHAAGKFGSALGVKRDFVLAGQTIPATGLCRGSVLLSRVPAVWITLASIAGAIAIAPTEDAVRQSILPATMLVCYGLWAIADIKLMTKSGAAIRPIAESVAARFRMGAER
jgi:hypothetical protein